MAAAVVQHNLTSCPSATKLGNQPQVYYPRKNWASVILFNCSHPDSRRLIPKVIKEQTPKWLLEFDWIEKPASLGMIPLEYNYLIGYYSDPMSDSGIKAVNYTDGGPWDVNYRNVDFVDEWDNHVMGRIKLHCIMYNYIQHTYIHTYNTYNYIHTYNYIQLHIHRGWCWIWLLPSTIR